MIVELIIIRCNSAVCSLRFLFLHGCNDPDQQFLWQDFRAQNDQEVVQSCWLLCWYCVPLFFFWREPIPDFRLCWEPHEKILTQVSWHVLFYWRTKSVIQNILEVLLKDRLLRAVQKRCLGWDGLGAACGSCSEPWLRTTANRIG